MSYYNNTETYFNISAIPCLGLGVSLRLIHDSTEPNLSTNFNTNFFKYARLVIGTVDPGLTPVNDGVIDYTSYFNSSSFANDITSFLNTLGYTYLIVSFLVPQSWLTPDNSAGVLGSLTGTTKLTAFANYILSGIVWLQSQSQIIQIKYIEPFNSPDNISDLGAHINPADFLQLTDLIRGNLLPGIQIMGCSTSGLLSSSLPFDTSDKYLNLTSAYTFDVFSVSGNENISDSQLMNSGSYAARNIGYTSGKKNILHMNSINSSNLKFITNFSTLATSFLPGQGTQNQSSIFFAIRCIENLCGYLNAGFSLAIFENLTYNTAFTNGANSLYDANGNSYPIFDVFTQITSRISFPVYIYNPQYLNPLDLTIKTALVTPTSNAFLVVCCRTALTDALNGVLSIIIKNTAWNSSFIVGDLTFTCFPSSIDTTGFSIRTTILEGELQIGITGLPLNNSCVLLISGSVAIPNQVSGTLVPVYVSVPSLSSNPTSNFNPNDTLTNGQVYYNVTTRKLMVYIDGSWTQTTPLH